jgi:hypothetical protein
MKLSDAGMRGCRTETVCPDHLSTPFAHRDAARDRSNRLLDECGYFFSNSNELSNSVTIRRVSSAGAPEDTDRWMSIQVPDFIKLARICVLEPDGIAIP